MRSHEPRRGTADLLDRRETEGGAEDDEREAHAGTQDEQENQGPHEIELLLDRERPQMPNSFGTRSVGTERVAMLVK